jgi:hypothetical protein
LEGRSVIAGILSFILLILIISVFAALIYHVATYSVPFYSTIGNQTVLSEQYIGKRDTNMFLEIAALLLLSSTIFYAGLLNYLKDSKNVIRREIKR